MEIIAEFPKVSADAPPYKQLEYYRSSRGLSKAQLGKMIGVPTAEIINYEKQFQEIYYEQAIKLSEALDIDIELLLDDYTKFLTPGYGARIKKMRASIGVSQEKFAKLMGVNRSTVSIWEIEYHRPSRENYIKMLSYTDGKEARST